MSDPSRERVIDQICTRFEQAWRAEERPRIEDYLESSDVSIAEVLLRELLLLEIFHRWRLGETPTRNDYHARFPQVEEGWLAEALAESAEQPTETQVLATTARDTR